MKRLLLATALAMLATPVHAEIYASKKEEAKYCPAYYRCMKKVGNDVQKAKACKAELDKKAERDKIEGLYCSMD